MHAAPTRPDPLAASASASAEAGADRRVPPALLVGVAAFSCLVVALQQTLVVPAVPRFPQLLGTTAGIAGWVVTATLLTGAVATPIIGRLADLRGTRRMLVLTMGCVLVGSLIAPLGGVGTLLVGRALQGVGTALVPVAMAQMRVSLPAARVPGALAILSASLGVGGGIGVPLGGVILSSLGWQAMFWISAGLAVVSLALLALAIPPARAGDPRGSFDLVGAVLLAVALTACLLVISQGGSWGWASAPALSCLGLAALGTLLWVRVERKRVSPLVDLRTAGARPLLMTHLSSLVMGVLMFMNLLLTTQTLQNPVEAGGFGWSAGAAGMAMLPNAAAMFGVAALTTRLAALWGPRRVLQLGAAVTGVGYLLRLLVIPQAAFVIGWTTLIGVGVGIGYAALPMLIVRYAPAHEMGSANGVNALLRAIGTALASALVATITAKAVVSAGGATVPSGAALGAIALIGAVLSAAALVLAGFASYREEPVQITSEVES